MSRTEQNRDLYITFADLTKAFDTVSREGLWKIMSKFGFPDKFITMVRKVHDDMLARVLDNGGSTEAFPVTNGVKQGCVLAPTLFSMMFTAILRIPSATTKETVLALGTELMGNSSACAGLRQKPRSRRLQCVTFCSQMTVRLTLPLGP